MDGDNALSEQEFCVAMKLVLLRRKGYSLPSTLPHSLRESIAGKPHHHKKETVLFTNPPLQEMTTAIPYLQH